MFHRFITWIMALLKSIWIHEKIQPIPTDKPLIVNIELEEGDDTLELLHAILKYNQNEVPLSRDPFDPILYRYIESQFENYSTVVKIIALLKDYLQDQIKDPDDSVYLDDPIIVGLSRGVLSKKEIGAFLVEGGKRDINSAFRDLLVPTIEIHELYVSLKAHPTLSEIKKDYCSRVMYKPVLLLKQHMDFLFTHGKLDDSEKESNQPLSNTNRS